MNAKLETLKEVMDELEKVSDEGRVEFLDSLPYCPFCGTEDPRHCCQCTNDE